MEWGFRRQRVKLEECEVVTRRITAQCEELQGENNRILIENGRLADAVSALEMSLAEVKTHATRELDFLAPRVQEVESKTGALVGKVEKNTLDVDLMAGLVCFSAFYIQLCFSKNN